MNNENRYGTVEYFALKADIFENACALAVIGLEERAKSLEGIRDIDIKTIYELQSLRDVNTRDFRSETKRLETEEKIKATQERLAKLKELATSDLARATGLDSDDIAKAVQALINKKEKANEAR